MNDSIVISLKDFNNIVFLAIDINKGKTELIPTLSEELKTKLNIDDHDIELYIEFIIDAEEEDKVANFTRLFLADNVPDLIVRGEEDDYRLVKYDGGLCGLDSVSNPADDNLNFKFPANYDFKIADDSDFKTADNSTFKTADNSEVSTSLTTVTNDINPAPTLQQRVIKIQFHLQNIGNSIIVIGQELIECKKDVKKEFGYGYWGKWLADNFNMTDRTARTYIQIAERFGNSSNSQLRKSISELASTQLIALLALPAGEEENFLAAKKADGTPVQDMTVRQLREQVKKYKADAEKNRTAAENLAVDVQILKNKENKLNNRINFLQSQINNPTVVEKTVAKIPDDYESNKAEIAELQGRIAELQDQLNNPADNSDELEQAKTELDQTKKQLERAKNELYFVKQEKEISDDKLRAEFAAVKNIEQLFNAVAALNNSTYYADALKTYSQKHPDTEQKLENLHLMYIQLKNAFETI